MGCLASILANSEKCNTVISHWFACCSFTFFGHFERDVRCSIKIGRAERYLAHIFCTIVLRVLINHLLRCTTCVHISIYILVSSSVVEGLGFTLQTVYCAIYASSLQSEYRFIVYRITNHFNACYIYSLRS